MAYLAPAPAARTDGAKASADGAKASADGNKHDAPLTE